MGEGVKLKSHTDLYCVQKEENQHIINKSIWLELTCTLWMLTWKPKFMSSKRVLDVDTGAQGMDPALMTHDFQGQTHTDVCLIVLSLFVFWFDTGFC